MSKSARKYHDQLVAAALRNYVDRINKQLAESQEVSLKEAQDLDRALRCCPAISDIDRVWVTWAYIAKTRGWCTDHELVMTSRGYAYPQPNEHDEH